MPGYVGRSQFAGGYSTRQRSQGRDHCRVVDASCPANGADRRTLAQRSQTESRSTRRPLDLRRPQGRKKGLPEEDARGTFWRGTAIETDTRLRVGRAIAKTEEEVARQLMAQLKERGHPDAPPPLATDGQGAYREAMVETWGEVPPSQGLGRPPLHKQPQAGWQYLQVV